MQDDVPATAPPASCEVSTPQDEAQLLDAGTWSAPPAPSSYPGLLLFATSARQCKHDTCTIALGWDDISSPSLEPHDVSSSASLPDIPAFICTAKWPDNISKSVDKSSDNEEDDEDDDDDEGEEDGPGQLRGMGDSNN
jgi:hypothetical protein